MQALFQRCLDNGFVYMDASTAQNGDTWYWGYTNASQHDVGANTLTFNRSASLHGATYGERMRSAATLDVPLWGSDNLSGMGLELSFERMLMATGRLGVALGFGLDAVWGISGDMEATTMKGVATRQWVERATDVRTDATYVYDLPGVVPPPAPYSGTYAGPEFGDAAPIIPNRPRLVSYRQSTSAAAERVLSSSSSQGRNRVELSTDAALYELWFGPTLMVKASSRMHLSLRPQAALNLVDARASRHEAWLEANAGGAEREVFAWNDRTSKVMVRPGCGLHGAVEIQLGKGWSAGAAAGYDWLLGDCDLTLGPNRVSLDLSGYTVSAQVVRQL